MTMADAGYDPLGRMGHQHHYHHQQHNHHANHYHHENNNNLPSTENHNIYRVEQKKHKRKRLSAVLDKLTSHNNNNNNNNNHNNNNLSVNHNNNIVGESNYKIKRTDSRSSTEGSVEDVFPYSASPRISISPLRLNEADEIASNHVQIKQEPQAYFYKHLQQFNPMAFFGYFPHQTKLLYQEIARQRSHSDSDIQQIPLPLPEPQEYPLDLSMKSSTSPKTINNNNVLTTKMLHTSPSLDSVIKQEPKYNYMPQISIPSMIKGDVASPTTKKSAAETYNLNVSPVVEEMPPGSDVAYLCPVCGQLFSLQDRLAKHMASRHKSRTGSTDITKSYVCEVCQRSFARSDMLTRHMRLHTGVKPYSCKVCGQIFSRSDHLSTHQRTHTGEKPYKCPQCPYAACRRDMITRHMRTHTRYEAQRAASTMDQKPILLPVVNLNSNRAIKKENYVMEAKTES